MFLLTNCSAAKPEKIAIPKPIINEVILDFKPIKTDINTSENICLDKEDSQALLYNIKMTRIYFNQQIINLKLTQDYYNQIIEDLYQNN